MVWYAATCAVGACALILGAAVGPGPHAGSHAGSTRADATALSVSAEPPPTRESCEDCHARLQPGLHRSWQTSAHADHDVSCADCHGDNHSQIFRQRGSVSPRICGTCHAEAAAEFRGSRHAHAEKTLLGSRLFETTPPALRATCFGCHDIGRTHADGSSGSCNHCHTGHAFRADLARQPEACTVCHVGEDYPQERAYALSKHGALHATTRDADAAPTCATCHQPGGTHADGFGITLGGSGVGRVKAGTRPPIPMPTLDEDAFVEQRAAMVGVCADCHSRRFAGESLAAADRIKEEGDGMLAEAVAILRDLEEQGLLELGPDHPLGGQQVRAAPDVPGSVLLNRFYDMWRFHYTGAWKGAYHQSFSVTNRESLPGMKEDLEAIRAEAQRLRAADKE